MKLTKQQLERIIKEELSAVMEDIDLDEAAGFMAPGKNPFWKQYKKQIDKVTGVDKVDAALANRIPKLLKQVMDQVYRLKFRVKKLEQGTGSMKSPMGENKKLKKLVIKELRKVVQEQTEDWDNPGDWDGLRDAYYQCRNKANGGNAPKLTMRRVDQHVAKAKSMPHGWSKLVLYVEKRYPGCLTRAGVIPSGA
tara:strand:+ start:1287 stop:1868 length:582 start_codon:yes stop_codon:yes gene_type:complete